MGSEKTGRVAYCRVVSCRVVSSMCELALRVSTFPSYDSTTARSSTTACDTTRFFAPHTIKWISSHICSMTKSGRHDKKLRQQKSFWKRFLSCVAATVSRKLPKKTFFIGISPGFINFNVKLKVL